MISIAICFFFAIFSTMLCEFSTQEDRDPEARQADVTAQRFFSIVEKNPQRGTALEKVFAHHIQLGTLDTFVANLQKRAEENTNDGVAWMLLGLFESQRRSDSQAIPAFAKAEVLRPDDPLPSYYRGQCLLRIGEPTQAVDALEKAILRKPTRVVLLEIFELLGRTHQRQNRNDLAIDAWKRLEENFPNDLRVLEQIAIIQSQEGAHQDALPRYERLITLTKDPFQRAQFRIQMAQLRLKLGANERGMLELQTVLGELRPDSWLYQDVQRKIEEVYLKSNDTAGLISYYENRMEKMPDDIESMVRLCKFLFASGRIADANQWIAKAIQRAPTRADLRKTYIDQLIADQQFHVAVDEYEQLFKLDPKNADILRDWGKVVMRDPLRPAESAKREAINIWNKMIELGPEDALTHIRIADLQLSVEMPEEAQKHFERAIEMQPEESQFREFLGDFFFRQNQLQRAYEVWNGIAEGSRRNADNVMRLAEIYEHAQQSVKAAGLAKEACQLADRNASMFVRAARLQKKAEQIDDALNSLSIAEKIADSNDQRESICNERIHILEASNLLKSTTESLQAELLREQNPNAEQMQLLVRYLVHQRRWREANAVVLKVRKSGDTSLSLLRLSTEIAEGLGDANQAIKSLRKLADSEKRKRQEYLERIARLQIRQKKGTDAIETAKEVVAALPSKIEGYEFLAQICLQANQPNLAIDTLRKALRIDPSLSRLTLALASALIENSRLEEAIELYWQTMAKATTLDEKMDLTVKLEKVYQKKYRSTPTLDRKGEANAELIDRLEASRKDPAQRRDLTICLAQVYQVKSDFDKARSTLAELLSERTRDTSVLQQLAKLSWAADDLEMAIDYQRQLVTLSPGQESESYLATLLRQRGDWTEANEIVVKLIQNEMDPSAAVKNMDGLIERGDFELVLKTLEPLLRREPDNWELLFRLGLAHAGIDQWTKSHEAFERILNLDLERTAVGVRRPSNSKKRSSVMSPSQNLFEPNNASVNSTDSDAATLNCSDRPELLEIALGRNRIAAEVSQGSMGRKWSPENFGEMRLTSIAWLLHGDSQQIDSKSKWIQQTLQRAEANGTRTDLIDAYVINKLRQDMDALLPIASALASSGEPAMQAIFIDAVRRRDVSGVASENKNRQPLTTSQLDLLVEAFQVVQEEPSFSAYTNPTRQQSIAVANAQMYNAQMAAVLSNLGQISTADRVRLMQSMQQSVAFSNAQFRVAMSSLGRIDTTVRTVVNELRFAGRAERAEAFLTAQCVSANTESQLASLCEYLLSAKRFNMIEPPLSRWFDLRLSHLRERNATGPVASAVASPTASPTSSSEDPTEFAIRFLERLGEQVSVESAVKILDLSMATSNQKFLNRDFPPLNNWSLVATQAISWQGQIPASISVPFWCRSFVTELDQKILQAANLPFRNANRSQDWLSLLQSRIQREEGPIRALEQLRYSLTVGPAAMTESVHDIAVNALLTIGQDPGCEMHAATALLAKMEFGKAIKVADTISPTSPQELLLRDLILLHASVSLNDKILTEVNLNSLKGQKLDIRSLQSIGGVLRNASSMGVASATAMLTNQRSVQTAVAPSRTTPKPIPSKESLRVKEMNEHIKNGNSAALKIAKQIVSKPRTYRPTSTPNQPATNTVLTSSAWIPATRRPLSQVNPSDASAANRKIAFETLMQYGELEQLISEAEERIAKTPDSFVLLEQLAEYYEIAGHKSKAIDAMRRALQVRPNASQLRMHFAEFVGATDKVKACDEYLELLRRDPNSGLAIMGRLSVCFDSCSRTTDLLTAIRSANFQSLPNREEILILSKTLLDMDPSFEVGLAMIEKFFDSDPTLKQTAMQFLYGTMTKSYSRLFDCTLDSLIPSEFESIADPWFGLQDVVYDTNNTKLGEQTMLFESILRRHRREDILEKLEPNVRAGVERMPGWIAGQVMLAIILESTEQVVEAKMRFAELGQVNRLHVGCPGAVAWRLAKKFVQLAEPVAAIRMLETLVGSNSFTYLPLEQRPVVLLARLWLADGQQEKAREAIHKEFETGNLASSNTRIFTYGTQSFGAQGVSVRGNAASQKPSALEDSLLSMGLPVEAYRLFDVQNGLNEPIGSGVAQTGLVLSAKGDAGKQEAIALLRKMSVDQAIAELLFDRAIPSRHLPALELMLSVPLAKDAAGQQIESELQSTLIRHAKAGKLADIEQRLKKLSFLHPKDVTIYATQARIRFATGVGDAQEALHEIERILPTINIATTSNDRSLAFSLWLVARECYQAGKHFEFADRLARNAYKAAEQLDDQPILEQNANGSYVKYATPGSMNSATKRVIPESERANIILLEWGRILIQNGETEKGIETWGELLRRTENRGESGKLFEMRESLATKAADAGQWELAKEVLTKLSKTETRRIAVKFAKRGGLPTTSGISLSLVQRLLDSCETPSDRFFFLMNMVFPNQDWVMLHSEEIDLLTLPPKNLGLKLVECALESNRVSELKIAIQKLGPSSNLDVLKIQIAIAEKDFEIAKDLLRKLFEEIQASNSKDFLFTVCQVAIPAFRVEELRASALPILKTLLERERERNNLTEAEFNALPLVVEIDATIGSQSLPQR